MPDNKHEWLASKDMWVSIIKSIIGIIIAIRLSMDKEGTDSSVLQELILLIEGVVSSLVLFG